MGKQSPSPKGEGLLHLELMRYKKDGPFYASVLDLRCFALGNQKEYNAYMNKNLFIGGGVIIIALAAFFFAGRVEAPAAPDTSTATSSDTGGIDLSNVSTTSVTHGDGYTITPVYDTPNAPKAPDYTSPVLFDASVGADVRAAVAVQLADIKSILDKNPKDIDAWLRLGTLHKIGGDYAGAETMWLYVSKAWPADYIAFNNLADLYLTQGKTAEAKAMYSVAISKAKADGKTEIATQLEATLSAVK
jgi:tetratricopeptide (TPR) repeat protein